MNWGDFKRRLDELGVHDEDELWYIDLHPEKFFAIEWGYSEDGSSLGWAITCNEYANSDEVEGPLARVVK